MAIQTINIGQVANDGTGDDLREAFVKVNNNFTELSNRIPEQTTASNLGTVGEGVFAQKVTYDLQFKKIKAGGNVTVTSDSNNVIISSVGGLQSLIVATDSGNITLSEGETFTIAGGNNVTTQVNGANGISINAATELSTDLTPQLGANLDGQNRDILNVRNIESLVHMVDVRDIYGFNFGTLTGSTSSIIEFLGSAVDINLGTISQPGLQDDSTIDDLSIDVGTITNPL
tara:strand:- start:3427 stop:4116 length:690 start_codon:yes stop_codon:yes gene_type:complete